MSRTRASAPGAVACLGLAACVALAACLPGPPTPPASATPSASSGPPSAPTAPPATITVAQLGDALRDAIDPSDIVADLRTLSDIAAQHGGNRAAGSPGYDASAAFVAEELRRAGYAVELQPVAVQVFEQAGPSVLAIQAPGAPAIEDLRDVKAMTFSAAGDVTASVVAPSFDPTAQPGDRAGWGCEADQWAGIPAGVIVLAQPGPCRRLDVVRHAQDAGAVALVTAYPDWSRDAVLRPTLIEPASVRIPVLGTTHAAGLALYQASLEGHSLHVVTRTAVARRDSMNVIAELPGADPERAVMLGGHLDSVMDGPGINDNGSGTMAILEIARELAALARAMPGGRAPWTVRVGFWTAEEIGLVGSGAYVAGLEAGALDELAAYLNFDMLGSPNGIRVVYDGAGTTLPASGAVISGLFGSALDTAGLDWELESIGPASDHAPFDAAGVPIGGLFSGANEPKSPAQAVLYGGTADVPADACYHLACDTVDNVDPAWLEGMARAAAWVVGALASGRIALGEA